jgi:hypothetical protein
VPIPLPGGCILGASLDCQGRSNDGRGQAERGTQGNHDDHETSLQPSKAASH